MPNFRQLPTWFFFVDLACSMLWGQAVTPSPERYSATAEYQKMMEELHTPSPSPAYIATGERPSTDAHLQVKSKETGESLQLTTRSTVFTFNKIASTLSIFNVATQASWVLAAPAEMIGCSPAASHPPASKTSMKIKRLGNQWTLTPAAENECPALALELLTDSVARLIYTRAATATARDAELRLEGSIPLFGLGERFWQSGLAGTHLDVRPADKPGEAGHDWVYVAIPFVYSPGGLGLYADTVFDSNFRFNATGSSFDIKVSNNPVSFYLFTGADPKAVLSAYTALTGRPQDPPLWTFGPWINAVQGEGAVLDMAQKIRADGIPASALWVFDEMDEPNNLGWPFWFSSYYGEPREFTNTLHAQGFKVLNYVHPYIRERMLPYPTISPAYQKAVAEKWLVVNASGVPSGPAFEPLSGNIDFTNPAAVDWWQTTLTHAVQDHGYDGWMEDFGEWVADTDRLMAGNGATLSEVYPLLYHKVTLRIVQALNPNVVGFSRSGSPGSQQFSPVLWGADQQHNWSRDYGLPSVITAGITAGMSGFSTWGPDILSDGDSKELWIRWAEFGALTPVMRDHVWSKPQFSVNLWYDAETEALFKKYAILHSALLPYFATYAAEAHRTGIPIMRHTVLEFPNDPRSYDAEYQYLLGDKLLVAPVIEPGATTRKLYLPQGEWVNYWSGDRYAGSRDITVPASLDQIPMLVRAGSVLPFKPNAETSSLDWSSPELLSGSLVWRIYLGTGNQQDATFTLPDGTSAHMQYHDGGVLLEGNAMTTHSYQVMLKSEVKPVSLQLNGTPMDPVPPGKPAPSGIGWSFDPATHEVHAWFKATNFRVDMSGVR